MVNSPIFGIQPNSSASLANSSKGAPLAAATTYNSSLDWTEYTGPSTYGIAGENYSPQTQITASNVNNLAVSYIFPIPSALSSSTPLATRVPGYTYNGNNEGTQSSVLSANGTFYILSNYLNIYGINGATGAQLATPSQCPAVASGSSLGAEIKAGTCKLGASGEVDPSFDFAAWLKTPEASGGPSHQHGWNIVNGVAWVPGWGCQIQGWQVSTGALLANLTGMCDNVPGNTNPVSGTGKTFSNGIGEVQVSNKYNEVIFWMAGSGEGANGGRFNVYACSLSASLAGQNCVANGGACTTVAGGLCSSGSTMLWRTFLMPADDGSTPNFATNLCSAGHIWVAGVPCQAMNQSLISVDGSRPDLAKEWGGSSVAPSTGCSGAWGQIALDETDGVMAIGTGDTGPDWNATLRMGPSILCNAVVGLNLQNGTVMWSNKSLARDINDQDCNLNTSFVRLPTAGPTFVKTCKSSITFAMNGISGQPLWFLDPAMPDQNTIHNSGGASPLSKAMICSPTNATACDLGLVWSKIMASFKQNGTYPNSYISGPFKMAGTNPHPHGYITGAPVIGEHAIDPLNATEMGSCTGIGSATVTCNPGYVCPTGSQAACLANDIQGKGPGYYEERYMAETEDAIDPTAGVYYTVVMTGPQEHDWIGSVEKQGQAGNISGTNLYFGGQQTTNATILAINIATGQVMWNYTRPIYYRGGIIATGGMVISDWPDGHLVFNDAKTGAVVRDINVGVPLLAPMSIAPDKNGVMHLLVSYGGTNHGILGEAGLHGPLGHGYVTTGAVISYVLGPSLSTSVPNASTVTSTSTTTITGPGGSITTSVVTTTSTVSGGSAATVTVQSTTGVSDIAFYAAIGVAATLAIVAGALVVLRRRPSA
ncbi:MAG: hypothetical protein OK455_06475 [Thaumarchaeota archaeon]|nr:hypothetical protein [Nitrososphaerota archaeon]